MLGSRVMLSHEAEAISGEIEPKGTHTGEAPPAALARSGPRAQNRVLAFTLASVAAFVFVTAIILAILSHHA